MQTESSGVSAWLLEVSEVCNLAVGQFELVHIVDQPEYISIPQAPEYCRHAIIWNGVMVPVMNVSSWLLSSPQTDDDSIVAILIYKNSSGELSYGGVKLNATPVLEKVSNDQECELPQSSDKLKAVSISCFVSSAGDAVPVLDIGCLFSKRH